MKEASTSRAKRSGKPSITMKAGARGKETDWKVPIAAAPSFITDRLPALAQIVDELATQGFRGTINLPNGKIEVF